MKLPKLILFDYGHTLAAEPGYSSLRGTRAVLRHAVRNPGNHTAQQVDDVGRKLFEEICQPIRKTGAEFHNLVYQQLLYDYLGLEFSLTPQEQERVFWDSASFGEVMPGIAQALQDLRQRGIRTAVISNISFSGDALRQRLDRLLPAHRFEFVLASSECLVRKPNPLIFELALRKAGLAAQDVWYCGDDVVFDVEGASNAGLFPVWYHSDIPDDFRGYRQQHTPDCEHLAIQDWSELTAALQQRTDTRTL